VTITLAQAAVFLIRITSASKAVQAIINLDSSVVAHYLKMTINLLETGDLSETRLSTHLANTIRDVSKAAGILGVPHTHNPRPEAGSLRPLVNSQPALEPEDPTSGDEGFDLDRFLRAKGNLGLGYLLGLPGDAACVTPVSLGGSAEVDEGGRGLYDEFGLR